MDHREVYEDILELVAFCGRYGGFGPPFSLAADLNYVQAYAKVLGRFIEQESTD